MKIRKKETHVLIRRQSVKKLTLDARGQKADNSRVKARKWREVLSKGKIVR